MANETVGFKTSLFGFSKKDVLACIDRLSAESRKAEQDARTQIEALQAERDTAGTENTELKQRAEESATMVSQLVNQVHEEQQRAESADTKVKQLEEKNTALATENQDYKRRLFQREEENVRLHRENDQLHRQCDDKQAQLDQQTAQLAQVRQACESRMQEIHAEEDARLAQARQEAEKKVRTAEQKAAGLQHALDARRAQPAPDCHVLQAGNEKVTRSLNEVKQDLVSAGENISRISAQLQHSTEMLEQALAEAEQQKAILQPAPEQPPVTETWKHTEPPYAARPAASSWEETKASAYASATGAAERLLDKLAKLLDQ